MKRVILLVCASSVLADNLLLDDFSGVGNPTLTDLNYQLTARQTGSSLGTVTWTSAGNPSLLGHAVMPDGLRIAGNGNSTSGWASPDHSFTTTGSDGGLVIEFDIDPQRKSPLDPGWLAIKLGMTASNRWTSVNGATAHLSVPFHNTGISEIYDGAAQVTWFANGVPPGVLTHVRLELTDATDGNPLDGVGETTIAVYVANKRHSGPNLYQDRRRRGWWLYRLSGITRGCWPARQPADRQPPSIPTAKRGNRDLSRSRGHRGCWLHLWHRGVHHSGGGQLGCGWQDHADFPNTDLA
jgi:hypothetical protein